MRDTRTLENFPDRRPIAAGLRHCKAREVYMFEDMEGTEVTIGAARGCDIRLASPFVSAVHAVLTRDDGAMWLEDRSSQGTTFVDGWPVARFDGAIPLLVGMEIQFGRTLLIATDEDGSFPIAASSSSELCAKGYEHYGSYRLAAEHLNRSHTTVRRQARRYRARLERKKARENS